MHVFMNHFINFITKKNRLVAKVNFDVHQVMGYELQVMSSCTLSLVPCSFCIVICLLFFGYWILFFSSCALFLVPCFFSCALFLVSFHLGFVTWILGFPLATCFFCLVFCLLFFGYWILFFSSCALFLAPYIFLLCLVPCSLILPHDK